MLKMVILYFIIFVKISLPLALWTWINIRLWEKLCLAYIWGFGYSGNEGEVLSCILIIWWCEIVLLVLMMMALVQKACSILVGHHDFSSFRAAGCQVIVSSLTILNLFYYLSSMQRVHKEVCGRQRHTLSFNHGVGDLRCNLGMGPLL